MLQDLMFFLSNIIDHMYVPSKPKNLGEYSLYPSAQAKRFFVCIQVPKRLIIPTTYTGRTA